MTEFNGYNNAEDGNNANNNYAKFVNDQYNQSNNYSHYSNNRRYVARNTSHNSYNGNRNRRNDYRTQQYSNYHNNNGYRGNRNRGNNNRHSYDHRRSNYQSRNRYNNDSTRFQRPRYEPKQTQITQNTQHSQNQSNENANANAVNAEHIHTMAQSKACNNAELEEEMETITALYSEQVTISENNDSITYVLAIDDKYIIQARFALQNKVNISVSNHEKCVERYSKKVLHKIQSKLSEIYEEESEDQPIYQCISYLNDSLTEDISIIRKEKGNNNTDTQNESINDIEEMKNYYNFVDSKHKKGNKPKTKESNLPMITIMSWGNKCRKKAPLQSQHNTNVCGVVGYKPRGINLKQLNGKDERIQKYVENGKNYQTYLTNLRNKITKEGLTTVSINCHKGRHRSVAFAELFAKDLRENYGYEVCVIHMEIS